MTGATAGATVVTGATVVSDTDDGGDTGDGAKGVTRATTHGGEKSQRGKERKLWWEEKDMLLFMRIVK